jgi:hypothetical protein
VGAWRPNDSTLKNGRRNRIVFVDQSTWLTELFVRLNHLDWAGQQTAGVLLVLHCKASQQLWTYRASAARTQEKVQDILDQTQKALGSSQIRRPCAQALYFDTTQHTQCLGSGAIRPRRSKTTGRRHVLHPPMPAEISEMRSVNEEMKETEASGIIVFQLFMHVSGNA